MQTICVFGHNASTTASRGLLSSLDLYLGRGMLYIYSRRSQKKKKIEEDIGDNGILRKMLLYIF
jgi:hypothetical protein